MISFFLNHAVAIIFLTYLAYQIFSFIDLKMRVNETKADWFSELMHRRIIMKTRRSHRGFVGSYIKKDDGEERQCE